MASPEKKLSTKCLKGTCGAIILYITNGLLLVVGIAGIGVSALVMTGDAVKIDGLEAAKDAIKAFVPETFVLVALVATIVITLIAILGFFGTCCQMKENKLAHKEAASGADKTVGAAIGGQGCCSKDACMSCGLDLYIVFTFVGLLILLAASAFGAIAFAGVNADQVEEFVSDNCGADCAAAVTGLFETLFNAINTFVENNKEKDGWVKVQNAFGCCGWWKNETSGTVSAISTTNVVTCCSSNGTSTTLIDQPTLVFGDWSATLGSSECALGSGGEHVTCGSRIVSFAQSNMQVLSIGTWVFSFITLVCFVSALVIRCAIKPVKKKKDKVKPGQ